MENMEINALTPSNFALSSASEARATRVAAENVRAKEGGERVAIVRESLKNTSDQSLQAQVDALRTARQEQGEPDIQSDIPGAIQFDSEEGTRVMKVLDSRDVLIYQVPSKGELALIRAEEAASRRVLVRA